MAALLTFTAIVHLVAAVSFGAVARLLSTRTIKEDGSGAVRAFVVWWIAMASFMAVRGTMWLAASFGWTPLGPFVIARYVEIVCIAVAIWGLTYYVTFLYTGREWLRPVIATYAFIAGAAYGYVSYAAHAGEVRAMDVSVALLPPPPSIDVIYLMFGLPPIVVTLGYLGLAFRPIGRVQRYRVVLVSLSILSWVGLGLAASLRGDPVFAFFGITVLGLLASAGVAIAYWPPRPIQNWLDAPARPRPPVTRHDMARRLRDLV